MLPRIHKRTENQHFYDLPTNEQLRNVMKQSLETALLDAASLGMNIGPEEINSCELSKGHLWDQPVPKNTEKTISPNEESIVVMDCTHFRDYSGTVSEIDGNSPFVQVLDKDGKERIIRKGSVVWKETQPRERLSNDRLKRVQSQNYKTIDKSSKNVQDQKNEAVDESSNSGSKHRKRKAESLENPIANKMVAAGDLHILDNIRVWKLVYFPKKGIRFNQKFRNAGYSYWKNTWVQIHKWIY